MIISYSVEFLRRNAKINKTSVINFIRSICRFRPAITTCSYHLIDIDVVFYVYFIFKWHLYVPICFIQIRIFSIFELKALPCSKYNRKYTTGQIKLLELHFSTCVHMVPGNLFLSVFVYLDTFTGYV